MSLSEVTYEAGQSLFKDTVKPRLTKPTHSPKTYGKISLFGPKVLFLIQRTSIKMKWENDMILSGIT